MKSLPIFHIVRVSILLILVILLGQLYSASDRAADQLEQFGLEFTTDENGVVKTVVLSPDLIDSKLLNAISHASSVTRVDLPGIKGTDELFESLARMPNLRHVSCRDGIVTPEQLLMLASRPLEFLDLSHTTGPGLSLDVLEEFSSLRNLLLEGCEWTDRGDASVIATLKDLESLDLRHSRGSVSIVPYIAKLPQLQHLEISGCGECGDTEIEQLKNPSLRLVRLQEVAVNARTVESWRIMLGKTEIWYDQMQSPDLQWLGPSQQQIGLNEGLVQSVERRIEESADFEVLKYLPQLATVKLTGPGVNDSILPFIRDMYLLQQLDLSDSAVTDSAIAQLPDFLKLESVDLSGTAAGALTLRWLAKQPNLTDVTLLNCDINFFESELENLKVTSLKIGPAKLVPEQLATFNPSIGDLTLLDCGLSDENLSALGHLELAGIDLSHNDISGIGLKYLNTESLQRISLAGCPITSEGLRMLNRCRHVESLNLSEITVTEELVESIVTLRPLHLVLRNTDLSPPAALRILEYPIRSLDLRGSSLSPAFCHLLGQSRTIDTLFIDGRHSLVELIGKTQAARNITTLILAQPDTESLTSLRHYERLARLVLSGAKINTESARLLVKNPSINTIAFSNCDINQDAQTILQAHVEITSPWGLE